MHAQSESQTRQQHSLAPPDQFGSTELALVLACARWPQLDRDRDEISSLLQQDFDTARVLLLAQHHRLVPLVAHNLNAVAAADERAAVQQLLGTLRQIAGSNTYGALRSLAEMRRLVQELTSAGVNVRVLKGIPLAQTVFGDLSLRSVGDLDILIPEDHIIRTDRILRAAGYRGLFQVERFSPKRLAFYRTHWKDIAYENPHSGYLVDLHWRCFRNSEMPGGDLCASTSTEAVQFGNFEVRTLPRVETLLYLCVHGTLDGWLYLKSLADIAASVRMMAVSELDSLAEVASGYGVLPELTAALMLVRRYFSIEHWSERFLPENDPTVAHILIFARRSLEAGNFLAGRESISAGSMMAFELGLRRTFRYRKELLLRVLFRARMWETIPLPDSLFGLYPLLSPFEWVAFRMRQRFARPPSGIGVSV